MNRDPKSQKGPYRDPVPKIGTLLGSVLKAAKTLVCQRVEACSYFSISPIQIPWIRDRCAKPYHHVAAVCYLVSKEIGLQCTAVVELCVLLPNFD